MREHVKLERKGGRPRVLRAWFLPGAGMPARAKVA
jgi:hypothetical protein